MRKEREDGINDMDLIRRRDTLKGRAGQKERKEAKKSKEERNIQAVGN